MNVQKSYEPSGTTGSLYLVGTPIGNLEDMTFRAIRILREVNLIAAEDTRQTRKLLTHYEISSRLVSYHEHNKDASGRELMRFLLEGQSVALVSDAGIPAISDPGYELVQLAIDNNVAVIPIPGANAALSALIISGLPTDRFCFFGFLPREKKAIRTVLEELKNIPATLLFYESPHRLVKTLTYMQEVLGDRRVAIVREITKRYEEAARGSIAECLIWLQEHPPKGEYCLVLERRVEVINEDGQWWEPLSVEQHVEHYVLQLGDRKAAMKQAAQDRGVSKRDIYNHLLSFSAEKI